MKVLDGLGKTGWEEGIIVQEVVKDLEIKKFTK